VTAARALGASRLGGRQLLHLAGYMPKAEATEGMLLLPAFGRSRDDTAGLALVAVHHQHIPGKGAARLAPASLIRQELTEPAPAHVLGQDEAQPRASLNNREWGGITEDLDRSQLLLHGVSPLPGTALG
jgi:hypothetical protein